jgi:hypothetical protein
MILAAFSGCTPQQRLAQGDWPPAQSSSHTTVAGSSWGRDDAAQLPAGQSAEVPGWYSGTSGTTAQLPLAPLPAAPTPLQTTAKSAGSATTARLPGPADVPAASSGVTQANLVVPGIDPALKDATWVGDAPAIKQAVQGTAPMPLPEIVTPAPPARMPEIVTQSQPVRLPEIVVEPKPAPVAVTVDTRSAPPGFPGLRLVNTKRFSLSFTVQDNGSGVAAVDLWETRDGKTWKKCDNAASHPNAYVVEVKDEGVFGYTLVARPTGDKSSTQPKPGDLPQVWVTVDVTKPTVSLSGVELNLTSKVPNLIVRWSAKDRNFGPRPVSIAYAEAIDGPWVPLAANVENSGRYECPVPANMPKRAFLRVEAVDLVGNSGSAQTEKQVRLDFASASATTVLAPPQPAPTAGDAVRPVVIINCVEPSTGGKD